MKKFIELFSLIKSMFLQKQKQSDKIHRSEDPYDYPCKPYFKGMASARKSEPLTCNPYLDETSIKDWNDGYKSQKAGDDYHRENGFY